MSHVSWTEITSFYNVRKHVASYPALTRGQSAVTYRAKVKLHGTNAGVIVDPSGTVTAESRTRLLSPEDDNDGFAKWVDERKEQFASFAPSHGRLVIFGEWCGPGIMKGVAVNQLKERSFVVFGIRVVERGDMDFIYEPGALADFAHKVPGCYVLPWFNAGEEFVIDWNEPAEALQPVIDRINAYVAEVEACDPWMLSQFGVRGVGEGLVFYPVSQRHRNYEEFSNLCFKAKGEKHKVIAHTKPVQADPTVVASAKAFAAMVVTQARLEQGARAVSDDGNLKFEAKRIGVFLTWLEADVAKETKAELEASGLDEKTAMRACVDLARLWYVTEMKKL